MKNGFLFIPIFFGIMVFTSCSSKSGESTHDAVQQEEPVVQTSTEEPSQTQQTQAYYTSENNDFQAFVNRTPKTDFPIDLSQKAESIIADAKGRSVGKENAEKFICGSDIFDCNLESRTEFFHAFKFDLNSDALAVVYYAMADMDSYLVLLTYNKQGQIVAARKIHGEFGDYEYALEGKIPSATQLEVTRMSYSYNKEENKMDKLPGETEKYTIAADGSFQ